MENTQYSNILDRTYTVERIENYESYLRRTAPNLQFLRIKMKEIQKFREFAYLINYRLKERIVRRERINKGE